MFRKIGKKRGVAALSVIAVLALAGGAFAYFTSSGGGTGSATVGTATNFTVTAQAASGSMYPGGGSSTFSYVVNNPGTGAENLTGTTATVASSGGNIVDNGTAVSGCSASWFTASNTAPAGLPQDLAGGTSSTSGSVTVTMSDSGTNQDACKGHSPQITISAS
jgi:hypothetical protein